MLEPTPSRTRVLTLKLWERLSTEIVKQELTHISLTLETSLIPVMLDMREKGVRVDLDKADLVRKDLRSKVRDYKAEIKRKTGIEIEPWASASVATVFEKLDLIYPKTEAGSPSFTKQYLERSPSRSSKDDREASRVRQGRQYIH